MTAAWIAEELKELGDGANIVHVNYLICENVTTTDPGSKVLDWHFEENPLPGLEFVQSNCDFNQMKERSPEYATKEFFPQNVQINQPDFDPHKEQMFKIFPEKKDDVFRRALEISE